MKLAVVPETLVERLLVRLGWVPSPLVHTQVAYTLARTIMAAVRANVFEVLASEPLTAEQTAERCGTHLRATRALLNALVGVGYLKSATGYTSRHRSPVGGCWPPVLSRFETSCSCRYASGTSSPTDPYLGAHSRQG